MIKLETGKVYEVKHARKGKLFLMITDNSDDVWIEGILMNTNPVKGVQGYDKWYNGEEMTVRRSLCSGWKEAI